MTLHVDISMKKQELLLIYPDLAPSGPTVNIQDIVLGGFPGLQLVDS